MQCGAVTVAGASFCSNCGSRLIAAAPAPPALAPSAPVPAPSPAGVLGPAPSLPAPAVLPQRSLEPLAIASVILGALAWLTLPVIGAAAAVITDHLAKSEIRRSNGRLGGGEFATVGLVLGYLQLAIAALVMLFILGIILLGLHGSRISL